MPAVPVEQLTLRSGVEKWKPDVLVSADPGVVEPSWYCELSTRGANAITRPRVQSGRSGALSSALRVGPGVVVSMTDSVESVSVGGRVIGDGVVVAVNEHAVASAPAPTVSPAAISARTRRPYPCTVSTPKIVLFYVFTPLPDPDAIRLWQQAVCEQHGLTGRIIVSPHGINATVGGDIRQVKRYVKATRSYPAFKNADIKWSDGTGHDFPRLSVRVRPEIVSFGVPDEVRVDADGVVGGGIRLTPREVNDLVEKRRDVVFLDGRNRIEAELGRFANAVVTDATSTRDFVPILDSGALDHLKHRPVITYCTGGVRCEVLSSLMRARGFGEVYQLDGGIVRYGEQFGDDGLWSGSLYVFDDRMTVEFSDHTDVLGVCARCGTKTNAVANFPDALGRELAVLCPGCQVQVAAG